MSAYNPKVGVVKKCHLCGSDSPLNVYSKPLAWPEETQQWLDNMCCKTIPPEAPVCCACEKFIKHYTGKDNSLHIGYLKRLGPRLIVTAWWRDVETCLTQQRL